MVGHVTKVWEGMDDNILQEVVHQALGVPLSEITNFYITIENRLANPSNTLRENEAQSRMEIQVAPRLKGGGKRWLRP